MEVTIVVAIITMAVASSAYFVPVSPKRKMPITTVMTFNTTRVLIIF